MKCALIVCTTNEHMPIIFFVEYPISVMGKTGTKADYSTGHQLSIRVKHWLIPLIRHYLGTIVLHLKKAMVWLTRMCTPNMAQYYPRLFQEYSRKMLMLTLTITSVKAYPHHVFELRSQYTKLYINGSMNQNLLP